MRNVRWAWEWGLCGCDACRQLATMRLAIDVAVLATPRVAARPSGEAVEADADGTFRRHFSTRCTYCGKRRESDRFASYCSATCRVSGGVVARRGRVPASCVAGG